MYERDGNRLEFGAIALLLYFNLSVLVLYLRPFWPCFRDYGKVLVTLILLLALELARTEQKILLENAVFLKVSYYLTQSESQKHSKSKELITKRFCKMSRHLRHVDCVK